MTNEDRMTEILELILETDCEPSVACQAYPELLPQIRQRLEEVRIVEKQLNELFPSSDASGNINKGGHSSASGHLPSIVGYDIEGVLGSGGMGVVYKARHLKLNRVVALKTMRAGQFATASERLRFSREFQAIAELHCPHIVQIYDVGDADGRPFFTMEFVEGGSLAELLQGKPQQAREAAELIATLSAAIQSAHDKGIIHRDLKPANILLSKDGRPKIADFGLARHVECDESLTITGVQLGTPSYMAPEQAIGSTDSVGPAVDVYALGAMLYEMLTGRPPFRAENAVETQRQVLHVEPVPPARINASVPRDLETICLKCLNKDPRRRYSSAGALGEDLQRFLRREPIHARPVSRIERLLRWLRCNRAISGFAFTSLALIGLATSFAIREYSVSRQRQAETEKWKQRLEFVIRLEQEGRFTEARAILGRIPDGGSSELRREIEQAQDQLCLAERLDEIRMSRGTFMQGGGIDYQESSEQYASAFQETSIGKISDNPSQVAARIKASTVHVALVAALDDWAACATAETRDWILKVAREADPDAWRDQVRNQQRWADTAHLEKLAETADINKQPVTLLVAMGTRWRRLGGEPTDFLQRVHHVHPDDFWLNFELAILHASDDPASALAHNLAALAIRPHAASVHFNLGAAYDRLGRLDQAIFHLTRATELDPKHSWATYRLAMKLFDSGKTAEALTHFRRANEIDPTYKDARNGLRIALIKLGQLKEAASVWEVTLDDPTANYEDLDGLAELQLYLGHEDKYHRYCEVLLEQFGGATDALLCERLGRTCLLKPKSKEVEGKAVGLVNRAIAATLSAEQQWAKPYLLFAKALGDYRKGHYEDAIVILEGEASTVLQPGPDLVAAMSFQKINKHAQSQACLARAEPYFKQSTPAVTREMWLFEILRREAFTLCSPIR